MASNLLISGSDQEADQELAIRDQERTTGADGNPELQHKQMIGGQEA